ncbi:PREDICTED: uncharacterized protein LOC104804654 [Tarenaya hassleriana]|uniref:uncharacterized protein LOC104804654 n=1 Tax=Tarenaya hassleriana TaxID=28532 RepID=UPI00053C780F|nr:PREDICTED: uncharacterized protein LOC104804654 [Tarenaya hassleriana]
MAVFAKTRRVTVSLGDEAKARIFSSSGEIFDGDSPCLSDLVHDFLEDGTDTERINSESDSDRSDSAAEYSTAASDEVVNIRDSDSDRYRNLLFAHVLRAVEAYSDLRSEQRSVFQQKITAFLRELGHDAAVCKSRWRSSATGLPSGSHEFIDVVHHPTPGAPAIRYFVDTEFDSNFEIARPTRQYARVVQSLPGIFVGKEDKLRRMVRVACEAAKGSLKSRGLSMPPWRRRSYLEKKWFGPYKRTTGSTLTASVPTLISSVSCRSVGFDDNVNGRLFVIT